MLNKTYAAVATVASTLTSACGWLGAQANPAADYQNVSVQQAAQMLEKNSKIFLLDVRTPEEHRAGHIAGTDANADWKNWQTSFASVVDKIDKNQPLMVYCARGGRSANAAKWLKEQGYNHVINVEGGFIAWANANLPQAK